MTQQNQQARTNDDHYLNGPKNMEAFDAEMQLLQAEFEHSEKIDELMSKMASFEEKYHEDIAELNSKTQNLTQENKTILKRLKEEEEKAQNANKQLKETMQSVRQSEVEYQKKISDLEEKYELIEKTLKDVEHKAEFEKNELIAIMEEQKKLMAKKFKIKIDLPQELWHNVFDFVSRPQMAELVTQIGDWYFASKVQYYLHESGQITLGELSIEGPAVIHSYPKRDLPLAEGSMPKNIKNFTEIDLCYFDRPILGFLQEFESNKLLTNINLDICHYEPDSDARRELMTNLMAMITSINSINVCYASVASLLQEEYSEKMWTSTRILRINHDLGDAWFCNWLYTPREDGKSRILLLDAWWDTIPSPSFIEHVKKDFMDSTQAVHFFIHIIFLRDAVKVQPISLVNSRTKQRLVIEVKEVGHEKGHVSISRHPIKENEEWLREMGKDWESVANYDDREITVLI